MSSDGGARAPHIVERGLMGLFAVVLGVMALIFVGGGGYLAILGGSLYYVVSGLLFLVAAVLLFRGQRLGAWVFGFTLALTIIWAIWEVGFDGWALLPRLMIPVAFGIWLLLPWSQHALSGTLDLAKRVPFGATGLITSAAVVSVALGAGLYAISAPSLPQDPRFQTGFGAFPAEANGAAALGQTGADWPYFGGDQGGQKYTPLEEITLDNVKNLEVAWSVDVGRIPANNSTPLKIDDSIYMCNGFSQAFALDAATGAERWMYDGSEGHGGTCRGVSYYKVPGMTGACAERVLYGTATAKLIALDARTGELCADFGEGGRVDLLVGMHDYEGKIIGGYYSITSAPTFVRGKVVVGGWVTDGQYWGEASGVIRAFDAVTGKMSWAWDLGRQDRTGLPPNGESYTVATPNSWAPAVADEELGLVYLPTGNATPDFFGGQRREFDDQFNSSVVALDAETGRLRWSFQTKHHDIWDHDVASPASLIDLPDASGTMRKALVQPTKAGEVFVLDRTTGEPIFPVTETPMPQDGVVPEERNSPTQPFSNSLPSFRMATLTEADMWGVSPFDQLYCRVKFKEARYEGTNTPPGLTPSIQTPSTFGAMNWGGVSVDPLRGIMVVNSNRFASYVQLLSREDADARGAKPQGEWGDRREVGGLVAQANVPYAAAPYFWLTALNVPCIDPPYSYLSAVDLNTGKMLWTQPFGTSKGSGALGINLPFELTLGTPTHGGSMITASGLVFIAAAKDNMLRAYELASGKEVWKTELPAAGGAPISYTLDGKQYIAVVAGGQGAIQSRFSTKVVAFKLPD
ncbi:membrane-bound PQQ-dependent dehydrogenase, glucose/quinate/shikimate family [Devosia sp. LjRoot3]|uniref:membrane-bound PQQ-dependent dehydrogenase, glucose/quinate/shikimate family n=1 Tax=Devosia sp. LjRoot3 TaxID=3342319 RepID=UPI003ECC9D75